MERWKARIRGVVGLGLIGALIGLVAGATWGLASHLVRSGVHWSQGYAWFLARMAVGNAIGFMKIGGFTAAGFGILLATLEPRRSLGDLSLPKMALFGAAVGAGFVPLYAIGRMGLPGYLEGMRTFLPAMAGLALVGAALSTTLVAAAKRAARAELAADHEGADVLPPTADPESPSR